MSGTHHTSTIVSVDEQALADAPTGRTSDGATETTEDEADVVEAAAVEETPRLRPSVDQTTRAKVDANHPDGLVQDPEAVTLAQEERIWAREAEREHISAQAILGPQEGRARRTREWVVERQRERRPTWDHAEEQTDPRATLDRETLAQVNQQADRIAEELDNAPTRAAVSRVLAEVITDGKAMPEAVFETLALCRAEMGAVCPITDVPDLGTGEVTVEGEIAELWPPGHAKIAWVGLIEDDSGQTKVTAWEKSDVWCVEEGDRVRLCDAAVNWYQGRWSLALTGDSRVEFPGRDAWLDG